MLPYMRKAIGDCEFSFLVSKMSTYIFRHLYVTAILKNRTREPCTIFRSPRLEDGGQKASILGIYTVNEPVGLVSCLTTDYVFTWKGIGRVATIDINFDA